MARPLSMRIILDRRQYLNIPWETLGARQGLCPMPNENPGEMSGKRTVLAFGTVSQKIVSNT